MKKNQKEIEIIENPNSTKEQKKVAYDSLREKRLNPLPASSFNPETFDPMGDIEDADIRSRKRETPPNRLPTMGMLPKKIMEGQMVGMFESPQDIYLIMAYYINNLLDRIEELEKKVP